eukprot:CAMPEP_0182526048 /NCGR_PEP_ID=MMETSP1323-20130603/2904_1 /TAXON_ID=236787 /ORGANISM="Florenciella parvula, Strain RCC1693" /LENGTH=74 /DNA_ID=CAMNT_0024734845 /DNA_START=182 /DNA_END=403 /DNA_ORIENTATION=-
MSMSMPTSALEGPEQAPGLAPEQAPWTPPGPNSGHPSRCREEAVVEQAQHVLGGFVVHRGGPLHHLHHLPARLG